MKLNLNSILPQSKKSDSVVENDQLLSLPVQVLYDGLDEPLAVLPDLVSQPLVEVEVLPARGHHGQVDNEGHRLRVEEDGERLQVLRHVQDPAQSGGL